MCSVKTHSKTVYVLLGKVQSVLRFKCRYLNTMLNTTDVTIIITLHIINSLDNYSSQYSPL